jgi:hypothetical protein
MDRNDKRNISGGLISQPAEEFAVRSASHTIKFRNCEVQPPGWCYVGVDDQLQVTFAFDVNNNGVICNLRILRPDGVIVPLTFTAPQGAARTVTTSRFQLIEGFLLSCTLMSTQAAGPGSIPWGAAALIRPPNSAASQYELLASGYLSNVFPIGFPNSVPQRPTDGAGQPRSIQVGNPAAGADWVFTVPGLSRARVISISATLATAVTVATRFAELVIDDGANVLAEIPAPASQLASLTNDYTWADSAPEFAAIDAVVLAPLPANLILPSPFRIRSETTAIQGTDQWSNIWLHVIEWLDVG